jgi:hypothetical protein
MKTGISNFFPASSNRIVPSVSSSDARRARPGMALKMRVERPKAAHASSRSCCSFPASSHQTQKPLFPQQGGDAILYPMQVPGA